MAIQNRILWVAPICFGGDEMRDNTSAQSNAPAVRRGNLLRNLSTLVATTALLGGQMVPAPAQAQSSAIFEKIASVLIQIGVDPDQIEAARYTINEPTHAGIVYSHAAAQDYPFFALVGARRVARSR